MNTPATQSLPSIQEDSNISNFFKFHAEGLEVIGEPTFDQWVECGRQIRLRSDSIHFIIGDWLNYGELHWGDRYRKAKEMFNFNIQTLRNDKHVADKVSPERRKDGLSFEHHKVVSKLEPEDQEKYLDQAIDENMTSTQLGTLIKNQEVIEENTKKPYSHQYTSPSEVENIALAAEAIKQSTLFLDAIDKVDTATLPRKVKKEYIDMLLRVERRCAGIEMEYGDE